MAAYLETLYADLRTIVGATWTDVVANGIWDNEHIEMIPWEDITAPAAAIEIPWDLNETEDFGVANQGYEAEIGLYYVAAITGDSAPIRGPLEALRDSLWSRNQAASYWQVLNISGLSWSDSLEPNEVFASKDYTHRAGRLLMKVLVGDW